MVKGVCREWRGQEGSRDVERGKKETGKLVFFFSGRAYQRFRGGFICGVLFAGKRRRDVIGDGTVELVELAFGGILHIPMGILVHGLDHPRANL
jgi:hypothetical protein